MGSQISGSSLNSSLFRLAVIISDRMDPQSLGRLLCTGKNPLGSRRVLQLAITHYTDDLRNFAASTELHRDFEPVAPTDRCKKKVGGGRCRQPASTLSVARLCSKHRCTAVNDSNLIGLRLFRQATRGCGDPGWENFMERRD